MEWELIDVPGNLNPSLQDSIVDVVAAKIELKLANTLIRQLSQVCPLDSLRHVKRVRRQTECGGKSELSIILCLSTGSESSRHLHEDVQKIVDTYQLSTFAAKVPKFSATLKEEWVEQCNLWPTSYHPAHDLSIVRGFQEEESPSIFNCMKTAVHGSLLSYLVWEPCPMCAIALVHQRFKHVFYAFPNPITGALGGVYRLHGERSLV
ncbi:probable inactive tRNA-specific adenosine deaminase-like protein 3 [Setaria italica]|uniref:tRNA-specific adenosine deaminase TAD3-like n=1 Tax=Setaria viridis TaxID=4556 RepID=UPI000645511D|nr:probable inactive tRNA-specific adenosine deaminase-like protein 3 [Setaria italica]XP_034593069.1 tRNA-specific adenosine deaminase TAD3-like [Setaria viridis]